MIARIRANVADFVGRKKSAELAGMNRLAGVSDGARDLLGLIAPRAHNPERNPLRRTRTDARHLPQLHNQVPDRRRIFRLSQHMRRFIPRAFASIAKQRLQSAQIKFQSRIVFVPPNRAPSEIRYTLPPSVSLDTELLRSRKNHDARHVPVRLQL